MSQRYTSKDESAVAMVGAAIMIPLVLIVSMVLFDLARLYLNTIYAQEIALLTAKLLSSENPDGYAFPDSGISNLIRAVPGEDADITTRRQQFWTNRLNSSHEDYWGLGYYPDHDKKVMNLAHQFALNLNPRMYFPIPEPLDANNPAADLGQRVNCSITFSFVSGHEPPNPMPGDLSLPSSLATIRAQRDRIVTVRCAVPLIGLRITGFSDGGMKYVTKTAYAYRGGNIRTTTG